MSDPTGTSTNPSLLRVHAGLPGGALVARRDQPVWSEQADLGNVVAFAPPRRKADKVTVPPPVVAYSDRMVPALPGSGMARRFALFVASFLLHAGLLAAFWSSPAPVASIGAEVISIEVTLGADTAAGLAAAPGEQDVQVAAAAETQKPEAAVNERTTVATVVPQDVPVAPIESAPAEREEPTQVPVTEERPQEQQVEPPVPQFKAAAVDDELRRIDAPTQKDAAQAETSAAAAPSDAASGVGRGRSDATANYSGSVAAHLARHKRYPAAARKAGAQGVATVSFTVDGGGLVTSVALASGSGVAAIDQEVVAMVRRASPFPAPPDGQSRNFTVPVRFNIR